MCSAWSLHAHAQNRWDRVTSLGICGSVVLWICVVMLCSESLASRNPFGNLCGFVWSCCVVSAGSRSFTVPSLSRQSPPSRPSGYTSVRADPKPITYTLYSAILYTLRADPKLPSYSTAITLPRAHAWSKPGMGTAEHSIFTSHAASPDVFIHLAGYVIPTILRLTVGRNDFVPGLALNPEAQPVELARVPLACR